MESIFHSESKVEEGHGFATGRHSRFRGMRSKNDSSEDETGEVLKRLVKLKGINL